jgi:hypothetical protein
MGKIAKSLESEFPIPKSSRLAHFCSGGPDCPDDVLVAGAAAQI